MKAYTDVLALAAVAGLVAVAYTAKPEWKGDLKPGAGSNISGTAEVEPEDKDKGTEAEIHIKGATAGSELPWHVHNGKCGTDGGIVGPATSYPVLKVKDDGSAKAEAKLDMPTPTSGEYSVNVHKSAAEMKTIVACGDLMLTGGEDQKAQKSGY